MLIEVTDLKKTYRDRQGQLVPALQGVSLGVQKGEFVAISGQWSSPAHGAGAHRERFASAASALSAHRDAHGGGADRRRLRPVG